MLAACIRSARHGGFVTVGGSESIYASRRDGDSIPVTISLADYVISSTRYTSFFYPFLFLCMI